MPTISVKRDSLFAALGRTYSKDFFSILYLCNCKFIYFCIINIKTYSFQLTMSFRTYVLSLVWN